MKVGLGISLQPEERFLDLLDELLRTEPDYFEITPESCWRPTPDGQFEPNSFARIFEDLGATTGKPFVAHGIGFSMGTAQPDAKRRARWKSAIADDHKRFDFCWYTDHLGASVLDGRELTLPIGLPYTGAAAAAVRASLADLQSLVPDVGVENSVFYFHLGDPLDEPAWLAGCLVAPRTHLLLDLHNVYTTALNAGFDPVEYVLRMPLDKVIELHVSGGSWSDPGWLPSGRSMRLDSHDGAVPDKVWELVELVLPRCPNLRGVTLERMEGTVEEKDVVTLREELHHIRRLMELARVH